MPALAPQVVLYSIRSERLLCEQLDHNLLFRWFIGLSTDDRIWDHPTLGKNRDWLIEAGVARKLQRRTGHERGAREFVLGTHDRLPQRAAGDEAAARADPGTEVGEVSMRAGQFVETSSGSRPELGSKPSAHPWNPSE